MSMCTPNVTDSVVVGDSRSGRGSISAVVVCWTVLYLGLAGLVLDGGRLVAEHVRLSDRAAAAARLGAQQLTNIRGGMPRVDCSIAVPIVRRTMADNGYRETRIRCTESDISVEASTNVKMVGLRLLGVPDRRIRIVRVVRTVQG